MHRAIHARRTNSIFAHVFDVHIGQVGRKADQMRSPVHLRGRLRMRNRRRRLRKRFACGKFVGQICDNDNHPRSLSTKAQTKPVVRSSGGAWFGFHRPLKPFFPWEMRHRPPRTRHVRGKCLFGRRERVMSVGNASSAAANASSSHGNALSTAANASPTSGDGQKVAVFTFPIDPWLKKEAGTTFHKWNKPQRQPMSRFPAHFDSCRCCR